MSLFYVVVEDLKDWSKFYPSEDVITFEHYCSLPSSKRSARVRVVNLCRSYKYLSKGYYTSLLAEARGHSVCPSVSTLNDLSRKSLYFLQLGEQPLLEDETRATDGVVVDTDNTLAPGEGNTWIFNCYFGQTDQSSLISMTKKIFDRFPCPILQVTLSRRKGWHLDKVKPIPLKILDDAEQTRFAEAFDQYSRKIWLRPKVSRQYRYDLAILVDPNEAMPPSDHLALKRMIKAAREVGIAAELITKKDYIKLAEYDALLIRETTAIDHHTYRFAKKAESEGMIVIDDSVSIIRCTNKIYLADLLQRKNVPIPSSIILGSTKDSELSECAQKLGFPIVLKIPDGSFSRGVVKVNSVEELHYHAEELMKKSALLIAQEFLYTDYDWRIGILNNEPLFACRYYMVRDHWQIYRHDKNKTNSGSSDHLSLADVPQQVIQTALNASRLIGDGLYGVDLKQIGDRIVVIEVNDNPNIDAGVEDACLGMELYLRLMREFMRRLEGRGK